jgi:hypothetical protein
VADVRVGEQDPVDRAPRIRGRAAGVQRIDLRRQVRRRVDQEAPVPPCRRSAPGSPRARGARGRGAPRRTRACAQPMWGMPPSCAIPSTTARTGASRARTEERSARAAAEHRPASARQARPRERAATRGRPPCRDRRPPRRAPRTTGSRRGTDSARRGAALADEPRHQAIERLGEPDAARIVVVEVDARLVLGSGAGSARCGEKPGGTALHAWPRRGRRPQRHPRSCAVAHQKSAAICPSVRTAPRRRRAARRARTGAPAISSRGNVSQHAVVCISCSGIRARPSPRSRCSRTGSS